MVLVVLMVLVVIIGMEYIHEECLLERKSMNFPPSGSWGRGGA